MSNDDTAAKVLHIGIEAEAKRARESWPLATPRPWVVGCSYDHRGWPVFRIRDMHSRSMAEAMDNGVLIVAAVNHYDACREAELRAVVAELAAVIEKRGRCGHCGGSGTPQCVNCHDYQYCRCSPNQGRNLPHCWACLGSGLQDWADAALARAREVQP